MEVVPTITIDCVDGIELYLNPKALQVEIVSSKSCAINVSVPDAKGDYVRLLLTHWAHLLHCTIGWLYLIAG